MRILCHTHSSELTIKGIEGIFLEWLLSVRKYLLKTLIRFSLILVLLLFGIAFLINWDFT